MNKRWKPKMGGSYYSILLGGFMKPMRRVWESDEYDKEIFKTHNVFRTKTQANKKLAKIKKILKESNNE